jgi:hypothetical protein
MATYVQDSFTGTAGFAIESRAGEVGATWTKGAGSALIFSNLNRARFSATGDAYNYYPSGTPASAEYRVAVNYVFVTVVAGTYCNLVGRWDATGTDDAYYVAYDSDTTSFALRGYVSGVETTYGSHTVSPSAGTSYRVELWLGNGLKQMVIDSIVRATSANNSVTGTGKSGLRGFLTTATSNTAGLHFDDFFVDDIPSTGNPWHYYAQL